MIITNTISHDIISPQLDLVEAVSQDIGRALWWLLVDIFQDNAIYFDALVSNAGILMDHYEFPDSYHTLIQSFRDMLHQTRQFVEFIDAGEEMEMMIDPILDQAIQQAKNTQLNDLKASYISWISSINRVISPLPDMDDNFQMLYIVIMDALQNIKPFFGQLITQLTKEHMVSIDQVIISQTS